MQRAVVSRLARSGPLKEARVRLFSRAIPLYNRPMSKIRVGIVGLEFGSKVLLPAFRKDPRAEVVALAGTHVEKAERIAKECGVAEAYGDWRLMLSNANLDAIAIATPPLVQVEIAEAFLKKGLPVFAEKPLGVTSSQTEKLAMLAHGLTTGVDFEFVEAPTFRLFKDSVAEARVPLLLNVEWRVETYAAKHFIDNWKSRPGEGGGALHAFGSHVFYNLEWCLGKIKDFSCELFKGPKDPRDTHTGFSWDVQFQAGHRALVLVDTASHGTPIHAYRFNEFELINRGADYLGDFKLFRSGKVVLSTGPTGEDGRIAAVASLTGRFLDGIESKRAVEPGFTAAHRVQCLIDKAFQSGKRVVKV